MLLTLSLHSEVIIGSVEDANLAEGTSRLTKLQLIAALLSGLTNVKQQWRGDKRRVTTLANLKMAGGGEG